MVNDNLLATYSLLSFIRESYGEDSKESLLSVFVPLVKAALVQKLKENQGKEYKGKDYSEIKEMIQKSFEIEIPIPVLVNLLPLVQTEAGGDFQLFGDHGFIIKPGCLSNIEADYKRKKDDIKHLKQNYKNYCNGLGVKYDFDELINFIQDQQNRIFSKTKSIVDQQDYHVSKYVHDIIKRKNRYFEIICSIYFGGIIGSYFKFEVNKRVFDTSLLIDTNFYISLINLNTEEAYETCKHLFEISVPMGFQYYILETTIYQIEILLSNRARRVKSKQFIAAVDNADILTACQRRGIGREELEAYKDNLRADLSAKGISIIYNTQIKSLIEAAKKSPDLESLTGLRGSRESAINDIVAKEYVEYKRKGKALTEFADVPCWFLNNSFTLNKRELNLPIWQRINITASDLLTLLWLANPAQKNLNNSKTLAVTSLSATVIKYRSDRLPTHKQLDKLQDRIARLQTEGKVEQKDIARLCIRMSEGCIDGNEAERLLVMKTSDLLEYIEKIDQRDEYYQQVEEESRQKDEELSRMRAKDVEQKAITELYKMRVCGLSYLIFVICLYVIYRLFIVGNVLQLIGWRSVVADLIYFILTVVVASMLSHNYCLKGLWSFICKKKILKQLIEREY